MKHRATEDRTDNHIMETLRTIDFAHRPRTEAQLIALAAQKLDLDPERITDAITRKAKA